MTIIISIIAFVIVTAWFCIGSDNDIKKIKV